MITNADLYILVYQKNNVFIIVEVYENDLTLTSLSQDSLNWLKDQLIYKFHIKILGKAKTIIGWEITRGRQAGKLKIYQQMYI